MLNAVERLCHENGSICGWSLPDPGMVFNTPGRFLDQK